MTATDKLQITVARTGVPGPPGNNVVVSPTQPSSPSDGLVWVQVPANGSSLVTISSVDGRVAALEARVLSGTGTPLGNVAALVGTLYLRTDGGTNTTLYVKESGTGTSGWVAK